MVHWHKKDPVVIPENKTSVSSGDVKENVTGGVVVVAWPPLDVVICTLPFEKGPDTPFTVHFNAEGPRYSNPGRQSYPEIEKNITSALFFPRKFPDTKIAVGVFTVADEGDTLEINGLGSELSPITKLPAVSDPGPRMYSLLIVTVTSSDAKMSNSVTAEKKISTRLSETRENIIRLEKTVLL
jgi:hypothetical protein